MRLQWLGHACFLVTSNTGVRIITDPYEAGFHNIISYDKINAEADIVTVSHEHGDHNSVASVPGEPEVVRGEAPCVLKGIPFEGLACFHDQVEGRERGGNTAMSFTVDDIRITHFGDLGHKLSQDQVAKLGQVDVLLAPVGGPGATMEIDELWDLCQQINPRIVIPMHFRNEKCFFPKYEVADFIRGKANVAVSDGSQAIWRRDDLPLTTKVVVLRHAL